ncbi:RDD family protein [Salimicrobium sp. PL1-032A]|uniref:RDD family protein n=1 Tax=Salimicrobium sp. PL1-032A TaxID=3095364 RepID=UPI0032615AD5
MNQITKKRTWAVLIDMVASSLVTSALEPVLKKKVKDESLRYLVIPTLTTWGLEYAQLKCSGQTVGYKAMGLKLESEDGSPLTSGQILKRIAYRDFASSIAYMKDKEGFSQQDGRSLAQDRFSNTIVTLKKQAP